jgi:hypothetical protein
VKKGFEQRDLPLTRTDRDLPNKDWNERILAKVSETFLDFDSSYEHIRERSEYILSQELKLAIHLNLNAVMINLPMTFNIENFARVLNQVSVLFNHSEYGYSKDLD